MAEQECFQPPTFVPTVTAELSAFLSLQFSIGWAIAPLNCTSLRLLTLSAAREKKETGTDRLSSLSVLFTPEFSTLVYPYLLRFRPECTVVIRVGRIQFSCDIPVVL